MRPTGTDGANAMTLPSASTLALGEEGTGVKHPFAAALAEPAQPWRRLTLANEGATLDVRLTVLADGSLQVDLSPAGGST